MSKNKHTDGPWAWHRRKGDSGNFVYLQSKAGAIVLAADEYAGSSWVEIENVADALLIAAAPDLLAMLKHAVHWHDQISAADVARYQAAIDKAEGSA